MKKIYVAALAALTLIPISVLAYVGNMSDIPWIDVQTNKLSYVSNEPIILHGTVTHSNIADISVYSASGSLITTQNAVLNDGVLDSTINYPLDSGKYYVQIDTGIYAERINIAVS